MFRVTASALLLLAAYASAAASDESRDLALSFNDWNITAFPDVNVDFSDASDGSEIQHLYRVHNRTVKTTILNKYCNETVTNNAGAVTVNSTVPTYDGDWKNVTVNVGIDQAIITDSDYFSYEAGSNNATAIVEYCLRLDLWSDGLNQSVNFHETAVTLDIDMTAGFTITGVDTNRTAATETQENATVNYTVVGRMCEELGGDEVNKTLSQGSVLGFCINCTSADVGVANIISAKITQNSNGDGTGGGAEYEVITDGNPSPLATKQCGDGQCHAKAQLLARFFENADPGSLNVEGLVTLEFGTGRRLANVFADGRSLQEEASPFGMVVGLQGNGWTETDKPDDVNADVESAGTSSFITTSVISLVVATFSYFLM